MYELTLLLHELYLLPLLALSPLILAMLGALKLFECTPGNFTPLNGRSISSPRCPSNTWQDSMICGNQYSGHRLLSGFCSYTLDIHIRTPTGEYAIAAAALDTQCQLGDCISERLVSELGMTSAIRKDSTPAEVLTVTGEVVQTSGTIYLAWKLSPTRVYRSRFFVLSGARHLDVILGQDTISEDNLLSSDSPRLVASFTSRKPLTKEEKAAISTQEARQKEEKKELEARREARRKAEQQRLASGQCTD